MRPITPAAASCHHHACFRHRLRRPACRHRGRSSRHSRGRCGPPWPVDGSVIPLPGCFQGHSGGLWRAFVVEPVDQSLFGRLRRWRRSHVRRQNRFATAPGYHGDDQRARAPRGRGGGAVRGVHGPRRCGVDGRLSPGARPPGSRPARRRGSAPPALSVSPNRAGGSLQEHRGCPGAK